MAVAFFDANFPEGVRQKVQAEMLTIREYNTPGFSSFRRRTRKMRTGEKGYRIAMWKNLPGGHTAYTADASDFNEPIPPKQISSYVYPTRYALPMIFDEAILEDFAAGNEQAFIDIKDILKLYMTSAAKRMNRIFYGDGTGALAYAGGTITALGSNTLTGETAAATSPGHTKGTSWLEEDHYYNAINASTGAIRGTFHVTVEGAASCTIVLDSGTITSGDPIVDVNSYNKYFRGLGHLISAANRIVQGINTATMPTLNSNGVDLAGLPLTAATIEQVKAGLSIRNNSANSRNGLVAYVSPGQMSSLRKQGANLRSYVGGDDIVRGIAERFEAGDTAFIEDADMDEDRLYFVNYDEFVMIEERPLGVIDLDGNEWRMILGANGSGSGRYQRAIGWRGNIARRGNAMSSAYIYRASTTGISTQVSY
jgi:hypothetical protein